ncbi:MAG: hypothetical protein VYE81_03050 [Planctomycetota bacterium]|nr:hypothetical protein [Planctomycetota bacterium]
MLAPQAIEAMPTELAPRYGSLGSGSGGRVVPCASVDFCLKVMPAHDPDTFGTSNLEGYLGTLAMGEAQMASEAGMWGVGAPVAGVFYAREAAVAGAIRVRKGEMVLATRRMEGPLHAGMHPARTRVAETAHLLAALARESATLQQHQPPPPVALQAAEALLRETLPPRLRTTTNMAVLRQLDLDLERVGPEGARRLWRRLFAPYARAVSVARSLGTLGGAVCLLAREIASLGRVQLDFKPTNVVFEGKEGAVRALRAVDWDPRFCHAIADLRHAGAPRRRCSETLAWHVMMAVFEACNGAVDPRLACSAGEPSWEEPPAGTPAAVRPGRCFLAPRRSLNPYCPVPHDGDLLRIERLPAGMPDRPGHWVTTTKDASVRYRGRTADGEARLEGEPPSMQGGAFCAWRAVRCAMAEAHPWITLGSWVPTHAQWAALEEAFRPPWDARGGSLLAKSGEDFTRQPYYLLFFYFSYLPPHRMRWAYEAVVAHTEPLLLPPDARCLVDDTVREALHRLRRVGAPLLGPGHRPSHPHEPIALDALRGGASTVEQVAQRLGAQRDPVGARARAQRVLEFLQDHEAVVLGEHGRYALADSEQG